MIDLKSYGLNSQQGPFFNVNEDDVFVDLHNNLFLVFDGFGGVNIGDKTVENIKNNVKSFYTKIGGDPDSTFPFFYSYKYLLEGNALINAMYSSHEVLKKENFEKSLSHRGGASMIGAAKSENILTFVSTGNCMAYLFRQNSLTRIVVPDVIKPILSIRHNENFEAMPLSGFGLFDDLHLQIKELKLNSGDLIIMMTDGAYNKINDDEIRYIVDQREFSLTDKTSQIFNTVNERGNLDNQSLLFLQF